MGVGDDTGTLDTNSINAATADLGRFQTLIGTLQVGLKSVLDTVTTFGKTSQQSIDAATNSATAYTDVLGQMKSILKDGQDRTFQDMIAGATAATASVDGVSKALVTLGAFRFSGDMFDKFTVDGATAVTTVNAHVGDLTSALDKIGVSSAITGGIKAFADNASAAQQLEQSYVSLAAQTGQLNALFQNSELKDLTSLTSQYTDFVLNAADATGQDGKATLGYAAALGTIPGFLTSIASAGADSATQTDGLTTAMKLMMGSGKDMKTVNESLTKAYEDLSAASGTLTGDESAKKGAQYFATISDAANTLGLRFTDVQKVMSGLSDEFKFIGDNTASGANILARYTDALRSTGLTSQASTEMVGGMIRNITELTVAQKAYISQQSGGPGGLQGAFKIEQMMRAGKTDDVMAMTEKVMRQKMGPIVGLNEAASDPGAAAQFQKQRMMLQSGVFGIGKGTSDEQATHLLEALRDKDSEAFKNIATGQKAVDSVIQKGNEIQKNNSDMTVRMANSMERVAVATELLANIDRKQLVGNQGSMGEKNRQAADYYQMAARDTSQNAGSMQAHDAAADLTRQRSNATGALLVNGALLGNTMKNGLTGLMPQTHPQAQQVMATTAGHAHHPQPVMVHTTQPAADAARATQHRQQDVAVHLTLVAPDGFEVIPKTSSPNTSVSVHNQLAQTGAWIPRK